MTLEEFKQNAQSCDDLGKALNQPDLNGCAGRIYLGHLWIQDLAPNGKYADTDPNPTQGRWHTIESNGEIRTNDLDQVERWLFDQRGLADQPLSAKDEFISALNVLEEVSNELTELKRQLILTTGKLTAVQVYFKNNIAVVNR